MSWECIRTGLLMASGLFGLAGIYVGYLIFCVIVLDSYLARYLGISLAHVVAFGIAVLPIFAAVVIGMAMECAK